MRLVGVLPVGLIVMALVMVVAPPPSAATTRAFKARQRFDPRAGRKLVFDDEFNGKTLDRTKWTPYDSVGNRGFGLRRPSAFRLDGSGRLIVTAQTVNGVLVSGGMEATYNRTYGYYEFRVRADPDPTRTLSAVVLTWPQSGAWPLDGENDVYETQDGGGHYPFRTFIHYGATNEQADYTQEADASRWHTIGMDWEPGYIKVYRDGSLVWTLRDRASIPKVNHHVCIQLDAEANNLLPHPVHMYVDYVRIYA
jgi:beta-glucanase (GH16 family)